MYNRGISLKRNITAVIKTMLFLALFTAVLLFSRIQAYADDPALEIELDGKIVKEFSLNDLQQLAQNESYDYSVWDMEPAFSVYTGVHGPTVEAVLKKAELLGSVTEKCTVTFEGAGGESAVLTGKQLFEKRYYYPNGDKTRFADGVISDEAYQGESETEAVISLDSASGNSLFIGQAAPNDENAELIVRNLSAGGTIKINSEAAASCAKVTAGPDSGMWRPGKVISLSTNQSNAKVYYGFSTSRSFVPGYGSVLYNYGNAANQKFCPVIPESDKPVYLCIVAKAYGMQDSSVQRYLYKIGDALTVKVDGVTAKTYDPDEFSTLQETGQLDYSGYSSYPTLSNVHADSYVRVDKLIADATGNGVDSYGSGNTIRISAQDGYSSLFTMGQLFGDVRYYYPNAGAGTDDQGGKVKATAYEGRKEVPVIISLDEDKRFCFGQKEPNEQNTPEFVKYMLSGGTIEIRTGQPEKCLEVITTKPAAGSVISDGTSIYLALPDKGDMRDKLYYIVDPEEEQEPDPSCDLYNYTPYRYNPSDRPYFPADLVNAPILSGKGVHSVAVKVFSYGKTDGDAAVLRYFVGSGTSAGLKAAAASFDSIKLTWKGESGISGYKLYRKEANGKEFLYKSLAPSATSFTDTGLKTGTQYTYRIAVTAVCPDGAVSEFAYSAAASAKTVLNKPALKKLTAGKKKITVKWSKVPGASGYEIYRSLKKSSGFKKVKTITKGSTVSYVNKKLKKGKKYYYKIRAYRTVNGKKVYSGYSAVKNTKAK